MKLATRISLFFLGALAIVLLGMSISIYALVRSHVLHRVEVRCNAAMDTIVASFEFDSNGVEWEANVRHLQFENAPGDGPLVWRIVQLNGKCVAGSKLTGPQLEREAALSPLSQEQVAQVLWQGEPWYIVRHVVQSPLSAESRTDSAPAATSNDPTEIKHYDALAVEVATPLAPALASIHALALALAGISITIWVLAAVLGRYLCNRALSPLARMAQSAGKISAADFSRRLPCPGTGNELDDLASAVNDLLDRLQVSFEQQRRFAAEASHQLRTPLTAVLGQLEVALRRERSAAEYRDALAAAQQQANLLKQVIESLLFLTRDIADASQMTFDKIELTEWLKTHLETWRHHPRFEEISVEDNLDAPTFVAAHRVLLGQAVDNLLDNACKYSKPNSVVNILVARQNDEVRIEVADQGCGIAASELPHVFDPFYRGAQSRPVGVAGFGLGLSVAKKIATFFGGRIEAQSTTGRGSRFAIILPTVAQPASQKKEVLI